MLVYHYHPTTFVYLGSSTAEINPLVTNEHFLPADATFTTPPTIPDGQQAVFSESGESWSLEDIPATPSASNVLPDFSAMTVSEKLEHYSLGGLVNHVQELDVFANASTVNGQLKYFLELLEDLQEQVNAIAGYEARVTTLEGQVTTLQADVTALSSVDAQATLNKNKSEANETSIQALEAVDTGHDVRITNTESSATQAVLSINTLETSVTALQAAVTSLQSS